MSFFSSSFVFGVYMRECVHDGVFDDCFYGFDFSKVKIFYYTGFSVTVNPTTKVPHDLILKLPVKHNCSSCCFSCVRFGTLCCAGTRYSYEGQGLVFPKTLLCHDHKL